MMNDIEIEQKKKEIAISLMNVYNDKILSSFNAGIFNLLGNLSDNIQYFLKEKKFPRDIRVESETLTGNMLQSSLQHNMHVNVGNNEDNSIPISEKEISFKFDKYENLELKDKFVKALADKHGKRHFQVYYVFKNKTKRMYRVDCMTRKINVNFYHYLKANTRNLNLDPDIVECFKINMRHTSKSKFQELYINHPKFIEIYENYLNSNHFIRLVNSIKVKYDELYMKLFIRHSKNFLNFYLRDADQKYENKEESMIDSSDKMNDEKMSYDHE